MKKPDLSSILVATLVLVLGVAAEAQQPGRIPRIGYLGATSAAALAGRLGAFRQGLRELGYIEGTTIAIEYRFADGNAERLPELAAELVALKVDLIITSSTPSVLAIKKASGTMPIVFTTISHPVENGIVASFARPGGNATGLTNLAEDLNGKRLELLKEVIPNVTRIGVLSDLTNPTQPLEWKDILAAAQVLRLKLQSLGVRNSNDFDSTFKAALRERAQALITLPQPLIATHRNRIVAFAAKNKLPAIYPNRDYTDAGGLMSYGRDRDEPYKRVAVMVDKILKGTKPADIPVEQPRKFEFIISLKAAKQIGLTIPPNVLVRADKVIK